MVVVNVYRCMKDGSKFTLSGKKQEKEKAVMTREYVDEMMANIDKDGKDGKDGWKFTGKYFEILEKETDMWKEKFATKQDKMAELEEIERAKSSGVLVKALTNVSDKATKTTTDLPEGTPNKEWSDPQIKGWLKEKNIPFGGRSQTEALLEKVKENI